MLYRDRSAQSISLKLLYRRLLSCLDIVWPVSKLVLRILLDLFLLPSHLNEMAFSIESLVKISNLQHPLSIKRYRSFLGNGTIPLSSGGERHV